MCQKDLMPNWSLPHHILSFLMQVPWGETHVNHFGSLSMQIVSKRLIFHGTTASLVVFSSWRTTCILNETGNRNRRLSLNF